ncbi:MULTISPECIES: general stress protein [unclassified Chelatococcus]|uniref:general stress protein n=1 Tax=unclassified Chelatococcus TaxID=2638111 RepID=UPI001BCCEC90|nr:MULTISPECIES: general stress protein [unclassified Chelatococcus]CAH1653987.1 conserved hypothetical protein [Hyphomicrobiales bacterium]MBS7742841.1 hypothetical protein [Chelatococcus sp. HY11]MBX3542041.1 hypothetical protein [Chelatococcus sp.]MCO5074067.1 hypothetical protein [Chelatococcus sp.]CAH1694718.1 conserved hypothetical protein [Hyphomicrobiales bacterium]
MKTTVSALFDDYTTAREAVRDLENSGIPTDDISIMANNAEGRDRVTDSDAAEDAGIGAGVGAAVGGVGGLLTGLGIMAIPGVGPVVAAGWLAATGAGALAGAAVGGAAGGLIGSMTGAGIPERDANLYAEGVRRGGSLVTARVEETMAAEARNILERRNAVDLNKREQVYRDAGWSRFDEASPPFTPDEIRRERDVYRLP